MPKSLTAPARLRLLLDWLNEKEFHQYYFEDRNPEPVAVRTDYAKVRGALAAFVASFDGSVEAAHVVATPTDTIEALDDEAIGDLEALLNILLNQGFGENPHDVEMSFPASGLRFAVRGVGRQKPAKRGSIVSGGTSAVRNYRGPGAYVLRVEGPVRDLVPFLLTQLLTAPAMATVKRCERPGCSHFVTESGKPGAPQRFCTSWCRELHREQTKGRKKR